MCGQQFLTTTADQPLSFPFYSLLPDLFWGRALQQRQHGRIIVAVQLLGLGGVLSSLISPTLVPLHTQLSIFKMLVRLQQTGGMQVVHTVVDISHWKCFVFITVSCRVLSVRSCGPNRRHLVVHGSYVASDGRHTCWNIPWLSAPTRTIIRQLVDLKSFRALHDCTEELYWLYLSVHARRRKAPGTGL